MAKGKRPRAGVPLEAARKPRHDPAAPHDRQPRSTPEDPLALTPLWAFQVVDLGGPWCWSRMTADGIFEVFGKPRSYESMPWRAIEGPTGSHFVDRGRLSREAQARLVEVGQDDVDQVFSLRITGRRRVWGLRSGRVLKLLWWDPEHAVCPAAKKHT